jgi:hypothetical protein
MDGWGRRTLAGLGLTVAVPPGWVLAPVPTERAVHLVAPPRGAERFRPTLTLHARPRDPAEATDLDRFAEVQLRTSWAVLDDLVVVDAVRCELAGHEARRVRLHHAIGAQSLTADQWLLQPGERVVVVTATSATAEVADRSELLDRMAAGIEILGAAPAAPPRAPAAETAPSGAPDPEPPR